MNAVAIGMQFYQQIESVRTNGKWNWEQYLPGPLDFGDVKTISSLAGCWCDVPSAGAGEKVRFYANQNHSAHGGRPF